MGEMSSSSTRGRTRRFAEVDARNSQVGNRKRGTSRQVIRTAFGFTVSAGALLALLRPAEAGRGVHVEAVDNYANQAPAWGPLYNSISDANGLLNSLVYWSSNPVGYVWNASVFDNNVITSNFHDNDITSQGDQDHLFFDKQGVAFSYFSGHGETSQGSTQANIYWSEQLCTHNIQCMGGAGFVSATGQRFPIPGLLQPSPGRHIWGLHIHVQEPRNQNEQQLERTQRGSTQRQGALRRRSRTLGESQFSGGWIGAGTNGGTNFVGLAISGASYSLRQSELFAAFAGVHLIGTVFTHGGDAINHAFRGYYFGVGYANPLSSVADAWRNSMNSLGAASDCGNYSATFSSNPFGPVNPVIYGGGLGHSGCGGHQVLALGATAAEAMAFLQEDWYDMAPDYKDARGNAYYATYYTCNYDCLAWPFDIP